MSDTVLVALISLIGTIGGSLGGILVSSKLTSYRIAQLEKKVDEHNSFGRLIPVMQEQIRKLQNEVSALRLLHIEK